MKEKTFLEKFDLENTQMVVCPGYVPAAYFGEFGISAQHVMTPAGFTRPETREEEEEEDVSLNPMSEASEASRDDILDNQYVEETEFDENEFQEFSLAFDRAMKEEGVRMQEGGEEQCAEDDWEFDAPEEGIEENLVESEGEGKGERGYLRGEDMRSFVEEMEASTMFDDLPAYDEDADLAEEFKNEVLAYLKSIGELDGAERGATNVNTSRERLAESSEEQGNGAIHRDVAHTSSQSEGLKNSESLEENQRSARKGPSSPYELETYATMVANMLRSGESVSIPPVRFFLFDELRRIIYIPFDFDSRELHEFLEGKQKEFPDILQFEYVNTMAVTSALITRRLRCKQFRISHTLVGRTAEQLEGVQNIVRNLDYLKQFNTRNLTIELADKFSYTDDIGLLCVPPDMDFRRLHLYLY